MTNIFNLSERNYLISLVKRLDNDSKYQENIHDFNYQFIADYIYSYCFGIENKEGEVLKKNKNTCQSIIEDDNKIRELFFESYYRTLGGSSKLNTIELINNHIDSKINFYAFYLYSIIEIIAKKHLHFYLKYKYYIDIVKYKLYNYENKEIDKLNSFGEQILKELSKIALFQDRKDIDILDGFTEVFNEQIDIAINKYKYFIDNNYIFQTFDEFKNQPSMQRDLLNGAYTENFEFSLFAEIKQKNEDRVINIKSREPLETNFSDNENKLPLDKNNTKSKEDNIQDEHDDKYKEIYKLLKNSISYASSEKIKKIIQYKINHESINPMYNKTYFVLKENIVANAAKIGYCFGLKNNEIIHFIRLSVDGKRQKITKTIPNGKVVKGADELDNIIIAIRNEYLHEIDPKVFPKI